MKINKTKLLILIIILAMLLIYPISVLGRYTYNVAKDLYLASKKFYFESDVLKNNNAEYTYENWNGQNIYGIEFNLYSYINELQKSDYDMEYTLECSTDENSKIICGVDNGLTSLQKVGYISVETNRAAEKIYLKVKEGETIKAGDIFSVNITATATGKDYLDEETGKMVYGAKYSKTLKAKCNVKIIESISRFLVTDSIGDSYATLIITNPYMIKSKVELSFNPDFIRIDSNNKYYMSEKSQISTSKANVIANGVPIGIATTNNMGDITEINYASKLTLELEPETTTKIKFYKTNIDMNYTYPNATNQECIIDVKFQNEEESDDTPTEPDNPENPNEPDNTE